MCISPFKPARLCVALATFGLFIAAGCTTSDTAFRDSPEGRIYAGDSRDDRDDRGRTAGARTDRPAGEKPAAGMARRTLAYPTGNRATSLILLEVDAPEQVRLGQPYNYDLRVTNLTATPLHDVRIRDLGPGEEVEPAAAATDAERDRAERRADRRAERAPVWEVGTLQPRQSQTRQVSATADEIGSMSRCLSVTYNPTLCVAVQVVKPELQLVKAGPEYAMICDDIQYTYRVTNTGTGIAQNVRVEDTLPEGLTTPEGGTAIALNVGDLAQGQTKDVAARMRARTGRFTSRAIARSAGTEAQSREVTTLIRQPILAITVEGPESRYTNEPVDYRVVVRNTGDAPAERTVVRLSAPGGTERLADRDIGAIAPGESKAFTVSTRSGRAAGDLRLTATAEARCASPVSETASVAIRVIAALRLECVDLNDPVRIDGPSAYTIRVTNTGTGPESNIVVGATVPPELTYTGFARESSTAVTADGNRLTFAPVATLAPGAAATWTIQVKGVRPGDARFAVEMNAASLTKPVDETESTRVVEK